MLPHKFPKNPPIKDVVIPSATYPTQAAFIASLAATKAIPPTQAPIPQIAPEIIPPTYPSSKEPPVA